MTRPLVMLGIETSCDETAAALVRADKAVLAHVVLSQLEEHEIYGGVVPEIAARAHAETLTPLIEKAFKESGVALAEVDGIAATAGPGLVGGVIVGLVTAKALALAAAKPLYAINHLEGHALSPRLIADVAFPYLLLLVSGGHCQLLLVEGVGRYRRLGTTIDDAVGEAFDKTAKMLGLGYPGGPAVERAAALGDAGRFALPRPLTDTPGCDFSFSGLKTAVLRAAASIADAGGGLADQDQADLAAGFQAAVADCLADRTAHALARAPQATALVVAGGVAANQALRARLSDLAHKMDKSFVAPPPWLCTDNAAMIAWAGIERAKAGLAPEGLAAAARARWPLDAHAAPARGAGVKA
ncbi:MAG: tRNA (adenosine(37)-N6)-threonylcarbamoyltransferase complex transferase subunit TsaD [Pseudomonadota bacterium]